jgi:hypothetical protein
MVKLDETSVAASRGERWGDWVNKVVCGSVLHLLISVELVCVNSGMRHDVAFIPGVSSQVSTRAEDASWFAQPTRVCCGVISITVGTESLWVATSCGPLFDFQRMLQEAAISRSSVGPSACRPLCTLG